MGRIVAVVNMKGGVGKTTSTANLAAALAQQGYKVLAVDLDPQASLTVALGLKPDELHSTIANALDERAVPLTTILQWTPAGFDLVPANYELHQATQESKKNTVGIWSVRTILEPLRDRYNFMILDCPANAGILTGAALAASDEIVIPTTLDYLAYRALRWTSFIINEVRDTVNPSLRISGIFFTMSDHRTRHAREMAKQIKSTYGAGIPFFATAIKQSVNLKEAASAGKTILQYAPNSESTLEYIALAREIDAGIQETSDNELYFALSHGQEALAREDYAPAYTAFCRATSLDPKLAGAWVGRGDSATEWGERVRCYARALKLDPLRQPVRVSLEKTLDEKNSRPTPLDIPTLIGSAHFLAEIGEEAYARNLFRLVTELDETHQEAWLGRARTTHIPKNAVAYIQKCLEINPDNALAQTALAAAKEQLQAQAIRLTDEASNVLRSGNRSQAHSLFRRAIEADPKIERAWLGCAQSSDDPRAASSFLKHVLEINPQNKEAQEMSRASHEPEQTKAETGAWWRRLIQLGVLIFFLALSASPQV
jgi:chromosome partitioning protein